MKRDREDFAVYWTLVGVTEEVIQHKAGLDFKAELGSSIVFDEAETFCLNTGKFAAFIYSCFCIRLIATPDNGAPKILIIVVDTMVHHIKLCSW